MKTFTQVGGRELAVRCKMLPGFARALVRPKLWQWQIDTLEKALSGRYRVAGLSTPRQNGKSYMGAVAGAFVATMRPGSLVVSVAQDADAARIILNYARKIFLGNDLLAAMLVDELKSEISLANGSRWIIKSSEAVSSRGLSPSLVVYDELGYARDRRLFDTLLAAQVAQEQPLLLAISTVGPRRSGPLFEISESEDEDVLWWHTSKNLSPLVTEKALAAQKRRMPHVVYIHEHENRWTEGKEQFVIEDDLAAVMIGEQLWDAPGPTWGFVDLGFTNDPSAAAIVQKTEFGLQCIRLETWQGSHADPIQFASLRSDILGLSQRFNCTAWQVEAWQGVLLSQELDGMGLDVTLLHPTAKSHRERWGHL